MAQWKSAFISGNCVKRESPSGFLIQLPNPTPTNKVSMNGWSFWHPSKLCRRSGKKGYHFEFRYHEDWNFKLFRNGKGKYNFKEKIEEKVFNVQEFEATFGIGGSGSNEA